MPRELGLGIEFKTNISQKCFVAEDFVFIKKRKKRWNIGTNATPYILNLASCLYFPENQTKPFG